MKMTAQQQQQLMSLLIYVARVLWEQFGKEYAVDFARKAQEWIEEKLGDIPALSGILDMLSGASKPSDFDAAEFLICDDQCTLVKPGECVTQEGFIDANCDGQADIGCTAEGMTDADCNGEPDCR